MGETNSKIPLRLLKDIEKCVADVVVKQRRDFTSDSHMLIQYGKNPTMQPRECAELCNTVGLSLTRNNVLSALRAFKLSNITERERVFALSEQLSADILGCLTGNQQKISVLDSIITQLEQHPQLKRVTLINLFNTSLQLKHSPCYASMLKMNNEFAAECMDGILMLIKSEYLFKASKEASRSIEEYERELFKLDANLNRANHTIMRLQDELEERLEEGRADARANLIAMLNSPKYGYILDLLIAAQKGFRQLRAQKVDLPYEISTMPTLIRKLLNFVDDCGITQMLEVGDQITVNVREAEGYVFEGTPFSNEKEVKRVMVTSPGWEMKDKGIVISNPVIKEIS